MSIKIGSKPEDFIWASGIEDTFVPQVRPGHRSLDEYQLMGHYDHWREDLKLAKDLGVQALRWGIPWYRVQPYPEEYDWSWIDEVLPYMIQDLGITPIIDLMHYGCPFWLRREFASDEYPNAVADYAAVFAERYKGLVKWYTPLNEPVVNALMCGKRGTWPPYLRGDSGYVKITIQLAKGIQKTVKVIKEIDPDSIMVHVEATGLNRAAREDLEILAVEDQRRGYLVYDLISGRFTSKHPLFTWCIRSGANPDDLLEMSRDPIPLDVIGMNFYPQWSTQQLFVDNKGRLAYRATEQDGSGFSTLISDYYHHYKCPIMVTETSAFGADDVRAQWLETSVASIKKLRSEGIPVLGYTWFPMFTMIDWRYRLGRGPLEKYRIELGFYKLDDSSTNGRWRGTPLVQQMQEYISNPEKSIGPLLESVDAGNAASS